jgi:hypothetical protein
MATSLDFHASGMANAVGADHGRFFEKTGGIGVGFVMNF